MTRQLRRTYEGVMAGCMSPFVSGVRCSPKLTSVLLMYKGSQVMVLRLLFDRKLQNTAFEVVFSDENGDIFL